MGTCTQTTKQACRRGDVLSANRRLLQESLALLPHRDRTKYWVAVLLQMATTLLDLAGVMLFGVVGILATALAKDASLPEGVQSALDLVGLGGLSASQAALTVAVVAAGLLITKSVLTLLIARRVTRFLARCAAQTSARMSAEFFSLPLVRIQHRPSQESAFALNHGTSAAIIDILNNSTVVLVELTLMCLMAFGLLLVDPLVAAGAILYFGLIAMTLTRWLAGWAGRTGREVAETEVAAMAAVQDGIDTFREATVAGHQEFYARRFRDLRWIGSRAASDQRFIVQIPRYGLDIALVVGSCLLVSILMSTQSIDQAVGTLAVFLAAASRVLPSLLRLNGARLSIHSVKHRAQYAFDMQSYLRSQAREATGIRAVTASAPTATPPVSVSDSAMHERDRPPITLDVRQLTVRYPEASERALDDVSFFLPAGASLALVGPSGAGKTTLADAILGIVDPSSGGVLVGGLSPRDFISAHPGQLAYVPQSVALVSGTVRENVALGVEPEDIDDEEVWAALESARLAGFLKDSRDGLDTAIGERGVMISGGQRQRLGIARALYSRPRLLVLDEATSALDAETENLITSTLDSLSSSVTTVTIAHRLATVRSSDLVLYLEAGRVLARGTFDDVRTELPQFDRQAQLLGL